MFWKVSKQREEYLKRLRVRMIGRPYSLRAGAIGYSLPDRSPVIRVSSLAEPSSTYEESYKPDIEDNH